MKVLELFSGTKSIGKAFERLGHEVISVDLDPTFQPTILVDMLTWDYASQFEPGHLWVSFMPRRPVQSTVKLEPGEGLAT